MGEFDCWSEKSSALTSKSVESKIRVAGSEDLEKSLANGLVPFSWECYFIKNLTFSGRPHGRWRVLKSLTRSMAMGLVCWLAVACAAGDDPSDAVFKKGGVSEACRNPDGNRPILGPQRFYRGTGEPGEELVQFVVPTDGTLCITVRNGENSPPQGERISSAWLWIDEEMVFAPEVFSPQVVTLQRDWPVLAGNHELAVKLASKPGSFLDVELSLLVRDTIPPTLSVEPSNGVVITNDTPLLRVVYQDDGSGIDSSTLMVSLNGENVTDRFEAGENEATWQVPMDSFLREGVNTLVASVTDRQSNVGGCRVSLRGFRADLDSTGRFFEC